MSSHLFSVRNLSVFPLFWLLVSCATNSYAPRLKKAKVEAVSVEIKSFQGRPDAYAIIKGRFSNGAAQLADASQYRDGKELHISVMERTPRGVTSSSSDLGASPPFESRVPIETLGLPAGKYTVDANGVTAIMEIPETFPEEEDLAAQKAEKETAPSGVRWKPAPLPAGTVKMLPPVQVNRPPRTAEQMAENDELQEQADPFRAHRRALPPGMSASVSLTPPLPPRTGNKVESNGKSPAPEERPSENSPAPDGILPETSGTVSTLSGNASSSFPGVFQSGPIKTY